MGSARIDWPLGVAKWSASRKAEGGAKGQLASWRPLQGSLCLCVWSWLGGPMHGLPEAFQRLLSILAYFAAAAQSRPQEKEEAMKL